MWSNDKNFVSNQTAQLFLSKNSLQKWTLKNQKTCLGTCAFNFVGRCLIEHQIRLIWFEKYLLHFCRCYAEQISLQCVIHRIKRKQSARCILNDAQNVGILCSIMTLEAFLNCLLLLIRYALTLQEMFPLLILNFNSYLFIERKNGWLSIINIYRLRISCVRFD